MSNGSEVVLFRKHSGGSLGTWKIWSADSVIYYAHAVVEGGAEQIHHEFVEINKSGRTLEQQVQLQLKSRVSRMMDKGYKATREEALLGTTNQLGFVNPMLAQRIEKSHAADNLEEGWEQYKYDGHRNLITKDGGEIVPYSRKGKLITAIPHICEFLKDKLPEGATIDGELYRHGWSLQKIASAAKTKGPNAASGELRFIAYDMVERDVFSARFNELKQIVGTGDGPITLAPTFRVESTEEVYTRFRQFRNEGFEGGILRLDLRGYEDGVRSNQVLKIKERQDADFRVVGFKRGKHDVAILVLDRGDGRTFDTLAPGPVVEKQYTLAHQSEFLHKIVECEFACLTDDGVPFHCVATRWKPEL